MSYAGDIKFSRTMRYKLVHMKEIDAMGGASRVPMIPRWPVEYGIDDWWALQVLEDDKWRFVGSDLL